MSDHTHAPEQEERFAFSKFFRTLEEYRRVVVLAVIAAAVAYLILAVSYYALTPAQRVTSLAFRLQFKGADRGEYPNKTKFAPSEILSAPVLLRTFRQNNLERFTSYQDFSTSLFVLEWNPAREVLSREYRARLSDLRMSAVDRERIQREYELKLASLSKDQYALAYLRKGRKDTIPEITVRKVLHDILRNWVHFVTNEQHVLEYSVPVVSPEVVAAPIPPGANPVVTLMTMRGRILRLRENIEDLRELPNAELVRTADGLTLNDLTIRLDDVVRYRLEPLVDRAAGASVADRAETANFLAAQLAYDERQLAAQRSVADAAQRTLSLYMNVQQPARDGETASPTPAPVDRRLVPPGAETVTPVLNETFLDRLVQLTASAGDTDYRRRLAEEYREASVKIVPLEHAVAYDRAILEAARSGIGSAGLTRQAVEAELNSSRNEVRQLAMKVEEIHKLVSRNLNPSTELIAPTAPETAVERAVSLRNLALYGFVICALAFVLSVLFSLLHSRIRSEQDEERLMAAEHAV